MNLRAPDRPKNTKGIPNLLNGACSVPPVHLVCREIGGWYIYIDIPLATNQFAQRMKIVESSGALQEFLTKYVNDPEKELIENWDMPKELKEVELVAPEKTERLYKQLDKKSDKPEAPKDLDF
jgi:hypothetical protein